MHVSDCDWPINGDSLGVAAALGLLSLALGLKRPVGGPKVAVTGAVDLLGRVHEVGGLRGKLQVRGSEQGRPSRGGRGGGGRRGWHHLTRRHGWCWCGQACFEAGVGVLLVPEASWSAFEAEARLAGPEHEALRAWAQRSVRPYKTMAEAVRIVFDPGEGQRRGTRRARASRHWGLNFPHLSQSMLLTLSWVGGCMAWS